MTVFGRDASNYDGTISYAGLATSPTRPRRVRLSATTGTAPAWTPLAPQVYRCSARTTSCGPRATAAPAAWRSSRVLAGLPGCAHAVVAERGHIGCCRSTPRFLAYDAVSQPR